MIYIVEDDAAIRELEEYALTSNGLEAKGFAAPEAFWQAVRRALPELVVLDVMLPEEDGFSILKKWRASPASARIPVLMVTAKSSELDTVKGLDSGADDYLAKPFGVMEFISRVKAALRRGAAEKRQAPACLSFMGICMDDARHIVTADAAPVELTYKEYELLKLFLEQPELVVSRERILHDVWGIDVSVESRTVDMHIRTLRQKLGGAGHFIKTVRKVGYMLTQREEADE
ncbi:MAG: response regulator transcription factor [Faecalibacterium sp.]|jgi:two-component system alkaline phosphatase synthesis response regulator PhoP|nr:response regulator transcription factor [Faecalibacterium sp.]